MTKPLKKYLARSLLPYSTKDLWDMLTGEFILRFDDGDLVCNAITTVASSNAWDFHRKYHRTPFLMSHHLKHTIGNKEYTHNTHLEHFNAVFWSVRDAYKDDPVVTQDLCLQDAYHFINQFYNEMVLRSSPYVMGLDITDLVAIINHPRIKEARNNLKPTDQSIHDFYRLIQDVLENDLTIRDNSIAKYARRKIANMGQVLQCVGVRGFVVDMNSDRFNEPIMRSYGEGITTIKDSLMDSRSASLSLASATGPLEDTEYFSRRLQLLASTLRNVHMVDCGSTTYMEWTVEPEKRDGTMLIQRDDLVTLAGKYYLNDDGTFSVVGRNDKHLYGQTIKMRAARHCNHPDPVGICARCYGQTAESIVGGNFGQTNTVEMTQQSGQNVMSTKHLLISAIIASLTLDDHMAKFFSLNEDASEYLLQPHLSRQNLKLVIDPLYAKNMSNIMNVKNIDMLNASRVADLHGISLLMEDDKGKTTQIGFEVGMINRPARFTSDLVKHIRRSSWTMNNQQHYVVDMKGWDYSKSILSVPMRFESMADHADMIADIIESSMKEMGKRIESDSPEDILYELHTHVNTKLVVPLNVLEVILLSAMVVAPREDDFSIPKETDTGVVGVSLATLKNRTIATFMAYEKQSTILDDPRSYVHTNRLSSHFDWMLMPAEASQYDELTGQVDWEAAADAYHARLRNITG